MFEHFEHTADLGLRMEAATLDELFVDAARALFAAVVTNLETVRPTVRIEVTLAADQVDYLLFDWLKTLLYRFDVEHLLFGKFEVQVDAAGMKGVAWGEPIDAARHALEHEIKAITYHGLQVRQTAEGWEAEVIVDI
ncbi:MAG: archease [Gemmataceae bacterium]|nr:archease [Gemmataceae bacterium]